MLFATDKFTLSFGDTAKLTIQYENTTLTNTGKKQAIVEASKDGYTWAQVASIAPESSLPLKIEALYVRLTTDTTISVVNTNPIPRDTKKTDIAVNINTEALVIKDDLQAYVSKNELNDLVHHPDLSSFVTKSQVQQMIPEIPTPPDITGLASKESVEAKADQTDVDDLKLTVATKADTTAMAALETTVTESVIPAIAHLNTIKADKTELNTLAEQVTQSEATVDALAAQVTGFQSELDDRVTKSQAEDANHILLNAIAARATTEQLDALHDEVEQKANQQQVDELVNKAFHLEQDKANKVDLIELTKTITLLESIISGDADPTLLEDIKTDVLAEINPELPALVEQLFDNTGTAETLEQIKASISGLYNDKAESVHTHQITDIDELQELLGTKANTEHIHTMSDVTGLAEALADKSDAAHTHAWASISGKPSSFIPSDHTHPTSEITGLDAALSSKADTEHSHTMDDVTGLQEALNSKSPTNHTHTWGSITGKPTTFNPTTHDHGISNITGLQAQLDTKLAKQEAETTYAKKTELPQPVDLSGYATKQSVDSLSQAVNALSGTGDVDLSGLVTKEELATKANTTHNHTVADIDGLQTALDGKAPSSHTHSWNSITSKPTTFTPSTHTHGITDVSGLQNALDAKAPATHSHTVNWADISGKPTAFNPSTHTHTVSWNALTDKPASYPPAAHSHDWNSITGKPTTFVPSAHTHAWTQITGVPTSSTAVAGIVQLNNTLTSSATNQALTAAQGKVLDDNINKKANLTHQHQWSDITTYKPPKPVNLIAEIHNLSAGDRGEHPFVGQISVLPNAHIATDEQFVLTVWAEMGSTHTGLNIQFIDPRTGAPTIAPYPMTRVSQGVYRYTGNLNPLVTNSAQLNVGAFYISYVGTDTSQTILIKASLTRGTQVQDYRPTPSKQVASFVDTLNPNKVPSDFLQNFSALSYSPHYGYLIVPLDSPRQSILPAGRYTMTLWGKLNEPMYLGVSGHSRQGSTYTKAHTLTGGNYVHTEDHRFREIAPNIYAATIEIPEVSQVNFVMEMQSQTQYAAWNPARQQNPSQSVYTFCIDALQIKQEDTASDYSAPLSTYYTPLLPASNLQAGLVKVIDSLTSVSATDALSAAQGRHIAQQFTYRAYPSHLLGAKVMRNLFSKLTVMTIRANCTTNKVISLPEAFSDTTYFWIARGESTKGWIKGVTTSTSRITLDSTDNPDATGIINILAIGYKA